MLGRVIGAHLVDHLRIGLERAIAVGEPFRYKDLVPLGSAQHRRNVAAEARRAPADIDRDIEDRTRRHAQQLGLGKRRDLEVESANDPFGCRQRMVVLYETDVNPVLLQHAFLENLRKEPTGIDVTNRLEELDVNNIGLRHLHNNLRCAD